MKRSVKSSCYQYQYFMRKTKIVATIGPACDTEEMIERMIAAGVDVFRFNMKHSEMEWHSERMELVETVCKKRGVRVGMLMDLQGPEIRIHKVPEKWRQVDEGMLIKFVKPGAGDGIEIDHPDIFNDVKVNQEVFADDGFLEFRVTKIGDEWLEAEVVDGGVVKDKKSVNFPGMHLNFPALIEKDIAQLSLAARHHVDFVALSFVRTADDIEVLRQELKKLKIEAMIIAKIEHPEAISNFDLILDASDGVMVARGDLGIEYPLEEVPVLQKMIVKRCQTAGKPVIVATQMLETMIENPRPTRAEVSDVANAVYDGADAVMLSAESAAGKYPVKAVKMLDKVTTKSEEMVESPRVELDWKTGGQTAAVVAAANTLLMCGFHGVCDVKAAVVLTETGKTAKYLSRLRPKMPIIAMSASEKTLDELKLVWGVEPISFEYEKKKKVSVQEVLALLTQAAKVLPGDKVVMIHGEIWGEEGLSSVVRVQEVV